jgi:hypothetical protein
VEVRRDAIIPPFMSWMKEHRSERPAVWDYANPTAVSPVSLRKRLASGAPPAAPPKAKTKAMPKARKGKTTP